jgi:acetolactate synthase-1/2/3 large subunit
MNYPLSRRDVLKVMAAQCIAALPPGTAEAGTHSGSEPVAHSGWITGKLTGAEALVEALQLEGCECVYGIPGAQENELWDTMKAKHLEYLLVTHEYSAACMADGYARSKGKPGVLCIVPGPGVTNSLSGIGEALLDSVPVVCIVGDVARGDKYRAFQVHELPQVDLLKPITKGVFEVTHAAEIPGAVRQAFRLAEAGEPGPVAVVVPYTLLIDSYKYNCPPAEPCGVPFDENAFQAALGFLADRKHRVGIYAGLGCMNYCDTLVRLAEVLQAPVATSVAGKGVIAECHPLAVGWGYGPQGTRCAEQAFKCVDTVLAIGVRYSEVSTGFYAIPPSPVLIHVDINPNNLGRNMKTTVCVNADAGVFMDRLLAHADVLQRPPDCKLTAKIQQLKCDERKTNEKLYAKCGADPMAFILALRRCLAKDALVFVDVTVSEHWAAEAFEVSQPRTYFNPTNNQAMGWSIPAALGAQRVHPGRQVANVTGDGCFLMTAMEISTAGREGLPVKFFILDDHTYHYMQVLQKAAYLRTTATILAGLNYAALAQGFGVHYQEIACTEHLEAGIQAALAHPGPVLTRVAVDYCKRPIRWIDACKKRYMKELCMDQKMRFAARMGSRMLDLHPNND